MSHKPYRKKLYLTASIVAISAGLGIIAFTFAPVVWLEGRYGLQQFNQRRFVVADPTSSASAVLTDRQQELVPVDTDFSILIPRIGAVSRIVANVDPQNEKEFRSVLFRGVAHAKGTGFPGGGENIYLFAHSTDAFYNAGRYNAIFYLIGKLENGDEVDVYYHQQLHRYLVYDKRVVAPNAVEYLQKSSGENLTLQTCYPPGTTLRRLVVQAKPFASK